MSEEHKFSAQQHLPPPPESDRVHLRIYGDLWGLRHPAGIGKCTCTTGAFGCHGRPPFQPLPPRSYSLPLTVRITPLENLQCPFGFNRALRRVSSRGEWESIPTTTTRSRGEDSMHKKILEALDRIVSIASMVYVMRSAALHN